MKVISTNYQNLKKLEECLYFEALNKRQYSRDFGTSTKLTPQELSQSLWSCYGENRPKGYKTTLSPLVCILNLFISF